MITTIYISHVLPSFSSASVRLSAALYSHIRWCQSLSTHNCWMSLNELAFHHHQIKTDYNTTTQRWILYSSGSFSGFSGRSSTDSFHHCYIASLSFSMFWKTKWTATNGAIPANLNTVILSEKKNRNKRTCEERNRAWDKLTRLEQSQECCSTKCALSVHKKENIAVAHVATAPAPQTLFLIHSSFCDHLIFIFTGQTNWN